MHSQTSTMQYTSPGKWLLIPAWINVNPFWATGSPWNDGVFGYSTGQDYSDNPYSSDINDIIADYNHST